MANNATAPSIATQVFGQIAFGLARIQPHLKTELHIILAALFPIVIGAHASLTRPSSAARPAKRKSRSQEDAEEEDTEDEEEDDTLRKMEGFSRSDALWLPLFAGLTLSGLYLLIKYLKDLDLLNKVLNLYFSSVGLLSVCKMLADAFRFFHALAFPKWYAGGAGVWTVDGRKREAKRLSAPGAAVEVRGTPLPGVAALVPLPQMALNMLWRVRRLPGDKLTVKFYLHRVVAARTHLSPLAIVGVVLGLAATAYYNFIEKTWWLTNLMGFAFSYSALQLITPTTFDTGSLILAALFVYDVVMVFYTPMMVTVAKNLEVPIKLIIPREADDKGRAQYSMLGLGDVVLPGMMIALALRFDLHMHYLKLQKTIQGAKEESAKDQVVKATYVSPSKHWADRFWTRTWILPQPQVPVEIETGAFSKTYFWSSIIGYVAGMVTTLFVMITWQHAQPALLYLVPGVLISLWGVALLRGDLRHMWEYDESESESESEGEHKREEEKKVKKKSRSAFSDEAAERNTEKFKKILDKLVEHDRSDDEDAGVVKRSKDEVEAVEKTMRKDASRDFFFFGISRYAPKRRTKARHNWAATTENVSPEADEHGRKRLRTA